MSRLYPTLRARDRGKSYVYSPHAVVRTLSTLLRVARGDTQRQLERLLGLQNAKATKTLFEELAVAEQRFAEHVDYFHGLPQPALDGQPALPADATLFEYAAELTVRAAPEVAGRRVSALSPDPFLSDELALAFESATRVALAGAPPGWWRADPALGIRQGVKLERRPFYGSSGPIEVEFASFTGGLAGPFFGCTPHSDRLWWYADDSDLGRREPLPDSRIEQRADVAFGWIADSGEPPELPLQELCAGEPLEQLQRTSVLAQIPLFSVRASFDMKDVAKELGIERLFDAAAATNELGAAKRHVVAATQSAELALDERGTFNAPAATLTSPAWSDAILRSASVASVSVDRPFLVNIYDPVTGVIFYVASIERPEFVRH